MMEIDTRIQAQIYTLNSNLKVLADQTKSLTQDMKDRIKELGMDINEIKLFIGRTDTELALINKTLEHYREREADNWEDVTGKQKDVVGILDKFDERIKNLEQVRNEVKYPIKFGIWAITAILSFVFGVIGSKIASLFFN